MQPKPAALWRLHEILRWGASELERRDVEVAVLVNCPLAQRGERCVRCSCI